MVRWPRLRREGRWSHCLLSVCCIILPLSISSTAAGDEPFICGGGGRISLGTDGGQQWSTHTVSTHKLFYAQTTSHTHRERAGRRHEKAYMSCTTRPYPEILWDTGGRLCPPSAWWATGSHGPASSRRPAAPGLGECTVAGA